MKESNIVDSPLTDKIMEKEVRRLCREQVESVRGVKLHLKPTANMLANRVLVIMDPGKKMPLLMQYAAVQTLQKMVVAELRRT